MTKYQIECNYRLALKRADELSETARNIMEISRILATILWLGWRLTGTVTLQLIIKES